MITNLDLESLEIKTLLMVMEAANQLLRSEDDVTASLIESKPSQNDDVTNLESNPNGFISRVWNWLENQHGFRILTTLILATSWFYTPPSGPRGDAFPEDRIMIVFSLIILVVSISGILAGNVLLLWMLNVVVVCIIYLQTVSYLGAIAEMSHDMSVDPTTVFWSWAPMFVDVLFTFINTVYLIKWAVLKATTTTRN